MGRVSLDNYQVEERANLRYNFYNFDKNFTYVDFLQRNFVNGGGYEIIGKWIFSVEMGG